MGASETGTKISGFGDMFQQAVNSVNTTQQQSTALATSFEQGDPIAWLNETHATAIDDAYGWLKRSRKTTEQHPKPWLRTTYFRHNWPIVDRQLERAGARLAKVLNDALH
jgi:hypothetical protein